MRGSSEVLHTDPTFFFLPQTWACYPACTKLSAVTIECVLCVVHVLQMAARGLVCLCRRVCATASPRQANTNEAHSFPRAGIWHAVVLRHSATTGAICWHILSFHTQEANKIQAWGHDDEPEVSTGFTTSSSLIANLFIWKYLCVSSKGQLNFLTRHLFPHLWIKGWFFSLFTHQSSCNNTKTEVYSGLTKFLISICSGKFSGTEAAA